MNAKSPRRADAGALSTDETRTKSERESTRRPTRIASADAYEPAGNRRRWLVVVARCPHCNGSHSHYGDSVGELLTARKAGCGRPYALRLSRLFHAGGGRHD
ncbi:hypothetical protein ACFS2C_11800 [Prauserella oleivorans]|uniref:Uncharacterized protein n=1 Tax=Prauserella oleivorans TaxID=1478153 RepID=A0ABW5WAP1_9PSEU